MLVLVLKETTSFKYSFVKRFVYFSSIQYIVGLLFSSSFLIEQIFQRRQGWKSGLDLFYLLKEKRKQKKERK